MAWCLEELVGEKSRILKPDSNSITNILTLRYDPSITPIFPKKTWQDISSQNFQTVDFFEKLIEKNIKRVIEHNQAKKISIALSGGVDSTLVLAMIRKMFPDIEIEALSIKFADSIDETKMASKIAEKFEANHHVLYVENYLQNLPKAISIIKLPFWDLHWFYVVNKAKTLSKILASGDGGDELFGGYTFRYQKFLSLVNSGSSPLEKVQAYLLCHERDRVPDQESLFSTNAKFSWDKIHEVLLPYFDNPLSPLEQVFLADYNGKLLYNFSPVNSRILENFEMKSLSPLLSNDLITSALKIPKEQKYDESTNVGKLVLRKLLSKFDINSIITNEKLGFNVDPMKLWKAHGHQICSEYLNNSRIVNESWIHADWIERYIDRNDLDVRYINKFYGLLAFEIWYRIFVTKEMSANTTLN